MSTNVSNSSSPVRDQALVATFAFGAVVCASLGTVLFHLRGGDISLLRGGLRLVLAGFLLFTSLWAVDSFVAIFIDQTSVSGCQIAVAFSAAFDQLARIALEEFLFWAMKSDARATCGVVFPQAVFFLRFILGGVFVGVQRPEFNPVCVATNLLWPLGVAVLSMDAFIVLMLVTRASSVGVFRDMRAENPLGSRSRGITLIIAALGLWIPLSIPMMLGISTFSITSRTALPAVGVLLVIVVIAFYFKDVVLPQKATSQKTSPYSNNFPGFSDAVPPTTTRELGNQESSTIQSSFPPDRFGRPNEFSQRVASNATERAPSSRDGNNSFPISRYPGPGQAAAGVGGMPVKGEFFPSIRAGSPSAKRDGSQVQPTKKAVIKGGKLVISYPIVQEDTPIEASPLRRIAPVDLGTAVGRNKELRVNPAATRQPSTPQQSGTNSYSQQAGKESQRKQVGGGPAARPTMASTLEPIEERSSQGASSTVLSSPATSDGGIRQRSPKHISQCFQDTASQVIPVKNAPMSGQSPTLRNSSSGVSFMPPPRSPPWPLPERTTSATTLQGPTKSPTETMDLGQNSVEELKNSAGGPSSQQPYQVPPSRNESVTRTKSIASQGRSVDVLVPPVPPLSPRDPNSRSNYQLEGNLGNQYRRSGPSSSIPRSDSVKNTIRPSRRKPTTPPPIDEAKPSKTPVQFRGAMGLPRNPRARTAETSATKSRDQTAMFVNNIDYNYSGRAQGMGHDMATKAGSVDSESIDSVVHRPRPIPRKPTSRSSGSPKESPSLASTSDVSSPTEETGTGMRLKASVLFAQAEGSPSQLPPLPPPPPTPKSGRLEPAMTKTSAFRVKTHHVEANESVTPRAYAEPPAYGGSKVDATKYMSKFSIATTMSPEDPPSSYLQSPAHTLLQSPQEELRRRSSPVLPVNDAQELVTPVSIAMDQPGTQSATTPSANQYSKPQDLGAGYVSKFLGAAPVAAGMPSRTSRADSALPNDEDDGREMVTFMLDRNTYYPAIAASTRSPQNSEYGGIEGRNGSWHCRVGEIPPTFSGRESMQTRRSPKPPPLQLDKGFKRVQGSHPPTSPFETRRQSIDKIQEQLKKFEESNVDDVDIEKRRMSLLRDIEMEMGMQENRWQRMRDDLTRASISTIGSNPVSPFPNEASPLPSQNMQSLAINLGESSPKNDAPYLPVQGKETRRPRSSMLYMADQVQISHPNRVPDRFQAITADDASDISEWAAQEGEASVTGRDMSPVAISSRWKNETYSILGANNDEARPNQKEEDASDQGVLWEPYKTNQSPKTTKSQAALWNSAPESTFQSITSLSPGPRPVTRRSGESSPVEESGLWDKPQSSISLAKPPGLWRAALQSPKSPKSPPPLEEPAARSRTVKPPRKSRQMSSLPDILENPEPLENKRDTLGIFRFPWGERSNTATLHTPFQNQRSMPPGNMGTGAPPIYPTLELQMQMLRSQQQPSSFFDYHDEEDALEDIAEDSDNDSFYDDDDDFFDEKTLWDIASLLGSDRVPSRDSLFPNNDAPPGLLSAQGPTMPTRPSAVLPLWSAAEEEELEYAEEEPSPPLLHRESSSPTLPQPEATLWVNNVYVSPNTANQGLFQDDNLWDTYAEFNNPAARAPLRQSKALDITSTSLWSQPAATKTDAPPFTHLWFGQSKSQPIVEPIVQIREVSCSTTPEPELLWSAPKSIPDSDAFGLPQPKPEHWDEYNDLGGRILRPRSRNSEQSIIESQSLWSQRTWQEQQEQANRSPGLKGATPTSPCGSNDEGETSSSTAVITIGQQVAGNADESQDDIVTPSPQGNDLWVPISILSLDEEHQGLFQVQQDGHQHDKNHCGTSKSPAALETRPTPRSSRLSLQELESHALWAPAMPPTFAQDWVTLSSVRPSTPPGQESSESGSDSPVSDISSVYSNVTGESTVASFLTGQASAQLKAQLVTDADWMAIPKGTEPVIRSRNEIASPVPNSAAALHDAHKRVPQPSTTRPSQPQQAAHQDTEEEAQFAVTKVKTAAQTWTLQRQTNPLSSYRQGQIGGFDPARHHPVFNVYILDSSDGDCHPAAQGYIHTLVNKNPDLIQR